MKPSPGELRQVKLWIDASATFPGIYAALGTGMIGPYAALQYGTKTEPDYATWPCVQSAAEVLTRRCGACHVGDRKLPQHPADNLGLRLHHLAYGQGAPRLWTPPWIRPYDSTHRIGSQAWMEAYADPRLQYSRHLLYNLSRPEKSLLLLAPLARHAGGYGFCGDVFADADDSDFEQILAAIQEVGRYLEQIRRFNMPRFRPAPEYVREMQRYGIVSPPIGRRVHSMSTKPIATTGVRCGTNPRMSILSHRKSDGILARV